MDWGLGRDVFYKVEVIKKMILLLCQCSSQNTQLLFETKQPKGDKIKERVGLEKTVDIMEEVLGVKKEKIF